MVRAKRHQERLGTITLGLEIGSSEWEMGRNGSGNLKQKRLREEMRAVWRGLPEKSSNLCSSSWRQCREGPWGINALNLINALNFLLSLVSH